MELKAKAPEAPPSAGWSAGGTGGAGEKEGNPVLEVEVAIVVFELSVVRVVLVTVDRVREKSSLRDMDVMDELAAASAALEDWAADAVTEDAAASEVDGAGAADDAAASEDAAPELWDMDAAAVDPGPEDPAAGADDAAEDSTGADGAAEDAAGPDGAAAEVSAGEDGAAEDPAAETAVCPALALLTDSWCSLNQDTALKVPAAEDAAAWAGDTEGWLCSGAGC